MSVRKPAFMLILSDLRTTIFNWTWVKTLLRSVRK